MSVDATASLMRTPLFEWHRSEGAKIVPFAGWEMPVEYEGIKVEHQAVRKSAGIFDVSHMGEVETSGPRAFEFLQAHLSNDLAKVPPGGAQYALLCCEDGGVLDDLITYRLSGDREDPRFLTIVNAANAEADLNWLAERASEWDGVEVADLSEDFAMIALQGPSAVSILRDLWSGEVSEPPARFSFLEAAVAGVAVLVFRTGYTGEDGVEFLVAPEGAEKLWRSLAEAGARPVGLGARDTLRMEVCYPLYGNELSVDRTPIEAGLKWCCALDKEFVGVEAMRRVDREGPEEKLVALKIDGRGIPRTGCAVLHDGVRVGEVTSGTYSPSLEVGIGMAYVKSDVAEPGTDVEVDVRGKLRAAHVERKPLYRRVNETEERDG